MSKEAIAIKALEALARLGNGDQYGNSTGNVIARTALFEIAEQPAQPHMTTNLHDKMLAAIDALFSASDAVEEEVAENLLLDVRDEINKHKGKELLHKLAAKSLTEGLRLDDWDKIGCVNHDCDKCKAQQEPLTDIYRSFEQWKNGNVLEHGMPRTEYYSEAQLDLVEMGWKYGYDAGLAEQPAQQEPVAFYRCNGCGHAYEQVHPTSCDCMEGSSFEQVNYYTSPPAREWVGLTEDEFDDLRDNNFGVSPLISAVEAKLKEKNT